MLGIRALGPGGEAGELARPQASRLRHLLQQALKVRRLCEGQREPLRVVRRLLGDTSWILALGVGSLRADPTQLKARCPA